MDLMTRIIISSVPGTVWIYFLTSHNPRGRHSPCPLHTPERSGGLPKVTHPNRVGRKLPVLGSEPNLVPQAQAPVVSDAPLALRSLGLRGFVLLFLLISSNPVLCMLCWSFRGAPKKGP